MLYINGGLTVAHWHIYVALLAEWQYLKWIKSCCCTFKVCFVYQFALNMSYLSYLPGVYAI